MTNDNTVAIAISAKNLTEAAFSQARGGLRELGAEAKTSGIAFTSMGELASKAGKAIAGAFVVTSVIQAGKAFIDLAGHLTDMSAKTGLSTVALQKLKYAAEQNGGSLDTVTGSIGKLNKLLAEGDKGAVGALGKLGLSFTEIRKMKPEDAFLTIGDAIGKVQDPMAQASLATKIFGKAGADNLPMFNGHLKETADQAEKMGLVLSDDVVAAGDQFGDTLSTLLTAGMALLGKVIGPFLPLLQGLADIALVVANALGVVLGDAIKGITFLGRKALEWIINMAEKVFAFAQKIPGVSSVIGGMQTAFAGVRDAAGWVHDQINGLEGPVTKTTGALKTHKGALLDVSDAGDKATEATTKHAAEIKKLAETLTGGTALKGIRDLNEALAREKINLEKLPIDALERLHKTIGEGVDLYRRRGEEAPRALQFEVLAIEAALEAARRAEAEFKQMHGPIQLIAPKAGINLANIPVARTARGETFETGFEATQSTLVGRSMSFQITQDLTRGINVDQVKAAIAKKFQVPGFWKGTFGSPQAFGQELSGTVLGAIQGGGNPLAAGAGLIGGKLGTSIAGTLSKSLTDVGSGLFSKALGGVLNSAIPVVGSLIGPLAGALWNHLFGSAGRDAVKKFADSLGGFDDLHKKLGALGAQGEQLWIKLTQGVGRNNPEQAKKVIDEINAALANIPPSMAQVAEQAGFQTTATLTQAANDAVKLWEYMKDSGQYTAEQVQQAWERAQEALRHSGDESVASLQHAYDAAKSQLKALDDEIASLQKSIDSEAPEEVMGVVEAQARARLEALQKERDAAAQHVEEIQDQLRQSMDRVATAIENIPHDIEIRVRTHFDGEDGPGAIPQHEEGTSILVFVRQTVTALITPESSAGAPALVLA